MPSTTNLKVLACLLVDGTIEVLEGSVQRTCSFCEKAIWVSKASLALTGEMGLLLMCFECLRPTEDARIFIADSQIEELKNGKRVEVV